MFFVDTDILSAFDKVGGMGHLKALFEDMDMAQSIYEELMRAKRAGYPYLDDIVDKVKIVLLSEGEFKDFRSLFESADNLHEGECQLIALCKSRSSILLSNDKQVKKYCKQNRIDCLDLEDILRALKLKQILTRAELKILIEDIEMKDWTMVKSKDDILAD